MFLVFIFHRWREEVVENVRKRIIFQNQCLIEARLLRPPPGKEAIIQEKKGERNDTGFALWICKLLQQNVCFSGCQVEMKEASPAASATSFRNKRRRRTISIEEEVVQQKPVVCWLSECISSTTRKANCRLTNYTLFVRLIKVEMRSSLIKLFMHRIYFLVDWN